LTFINSEGVCCLIDPCPCSELAPDLGDAFEFHLSGRAYVERHEDRGSGSRASGSTYSLVLSLRWVTAPRRALESLGAIRGDRRHAEHGFVVALHLDRGLLLKRRDEALPRPRVLYGVTAEDPVLASGSEDAHDRIDVTALYGIGQRLHGFVGRAEREHSTLT
jgi:hypothetical protein